MADALDRAQVKQLLAIMRVGYRQCAEDLGLLKPYISLNQAYKTYGRKTVDRWADEKLISIIKDGTGTSKCRIKREEIELVAATSNRASWYDNHEE